MKRSFLFVLAILCSFLFSQPGFAVSEAAVLSLLISPSPQANAMGQTYGALWSNDPMSSAINPAAVGLYARSHMAGAAFFPEKVSWLPQFGNDLWLSSTAYNLGLNLEPATKFPVCIGVGFFKSRLDLGEQVHTDETGSELGRFHSYEDYANTTLSAAVDYFLQLSVGYTFKSIDSKLGPIVGGGEARAQVNAHDWGLIVQAPIADILDRLDKPVTIASTITPFVTPGFSWSKRHIGDSVNYIDAAQADPLPRQAYIGVNVDAGLHYHQNSTAFDLVHYSWAREMDDLLIEREPSGNWKYLSGLNDINFWDNVILGKANSNAIMHQGWQIGLADVIFIRRGHYEDIEGKVTFDTKGYGINMTQPFRLAAALLNYKWDKTWLNILLNIDVEYHQSAWDVEEGHPLADTEFKGVTISLGKGFF